MRPVTIEDTRVVTHEAATTNSVSASSSVGDAAREAVDFYFDGQPLDMPERKAWQEIKVRLWRLESRLATAEAERAALAADADRLSWLQHIAQVSRYGVAIAPVGATRLALWEPLDGEIPDGWCLARSAFSLRDAIDEGRAQEDARRPPTPGDTP